MSNGNNFDTASDLTELGDLRAFQGLQFSDDLCTSCQSHLAIDGVGLCALCTCEHDQARSELLEFDPELSDAINGMGSAWVW
ncbi:MAG: hypothetical protein DRP09_10405 [Candidatus Thorarchaeota archaeon]|nr:MAG: hypothetical protein DRP09_10405 [Candidatus Thorarchaeota archaeon]